MLDLYPGYWDEVQHYNMIPVRVICHPVAAIPMGMFFVGLWFYATGRALWKGIREGWDG